MSAPCISRNVPLLFPFMLGEENHNNHHAAPSSISTWHRAWQVDLWPLVVRCFSALGLVRSMRGFRASRTGVDVDAAVGAIRGRVDLQSAAGRAHSFWDAAEDGALPICVQCAIVVAMLVLAARWRWRSVRSAVAGGDRWVTALLAGVALCMLTQSWMCVLVSDRRADGPFAAVNAAVDALPATAPLVAVLWVAGVAVALAGTLVVSGVVFLAIFLPALLVGTAARRGLLLLLRLLLRPQAPAPTKRKAA